MLTDSLILIRVKCEGSINLHDPPKNYHLIPFVPFESIFFVTDVHVDRLIFCLHCYISKVQKLQCYVIQSMLIHGTFNFILLFFFQFSCELRVFFSLWPHMGYVCIKCFVYNTNINILTFCTTIKFTSNPNKNTYQKK